MSLVLFFSLNILLKVRSVIEHLKVHFVQVVKFLDCSIVKLREIFPSQILNSSSCLHMSLCNNPFLQ